MTAARATHRPLVIASVMSGMSMVAIEATIISTAMPQIVGQLGGLALYSWVFSGYLLTQTAATVVFGKLSDVYGRKPVMLAGIAVFLLGSVLCGLAWSMPSLIAFRLIQGIGGGAVQPVALTIVGDLYDAEERGRVQGFLASVWAISAVLGPLAGGFIIQHASWAWVFWINVPLGLASAAGFALHLHETVTRERRAIDVAGAVLFTVCVAALMVALTQGGHSDWRGAGLAALVFVASTWLFVRQERRAPEPMISFALWGRRPIAAANGSALLAGMALIGLTTFLPMYVQGVLRQTPVVAGLALTAMVLGWPLGSTFAARRLARYGLRRLLVAGVILLPLGASVFPMLGPATPPAVAGAGSLVMGLGMGVLSTTSLVLIQEIVAWSQRGSATASNVFARNLGSTLGATFFGAVLNWGLSSAGGVSSDDLRRVIEGGVVGGSGAVEGLRGVLQGALHGTFVAMFVVAAGATVLGLMVPHVPLGRAREATGTD